MSNSQRWAMVVVIVFVMAGIGCGIWLGFFHDVHEDKREASIEDRHNEAVGAKVLPVAPVVLEFKSHRGDCFVIDKAEFDGDKIWITWHAVCSETYEALRWRQFSPDNTLIGSGYSWIVAGDGVERDTKGEAKTDSQFTLDPRTVKVVLRISRD